MKRACLIGFFALITCGCAPQALSVSNGAPSSTSPPKEGPPPASSASSAAPSQPSPPKEGSSSSSSDAFLDLECDTETGQLRLKNSPTALPGKARNYYARRYCSARERSPLLVNGESLERAKSACPRPATGKGSMPRNQHQPECFKLKNEALPSSDKQTTTLWFASHDEDPQLALELERQSEDDKIKISSPKWTVALELDYTPDGTLRLVHPTNFQWNKQDRLAVAVYNAPDDFDLFIEGERAFSAVCEEAHKDATCFDVPMLKGVGTGHKLQLDFSAGPTGAFTKLAFELDTQNRIRATHVTSTHDYYRALENAYAQAKRIIKREKLLKCLDGNSRTTIPRNLYCPEQDFAILFFDETGTSPFALERVDEDDEVVIVVVPRNGKPIEELTLTTCGNADHARVAGSIAIAREAIQGSGGLGDGQQGTNAQQNQLAQAKKELDEQNAEVKKNHDRAADLKSKAEKLPTLKDEQDPKKMANALIQALKELANDQDLQASKEEIANLIKRAEAAQNNKGELQSLIDKAQSIIDKQVISYESKASEARQNVAKAERDISAIQEQIQARATARMLIAKACAAPGMTLMVRGEGQQKSSQISIKTLPIYRFSVGLALIADFATNVEYRAMSMKGETLPVIQRVDKTQGLAPPMPFIAFRPWGTSIERKRRALSIEGLGIGIGISLVEPLDHFYPGLLYEPVPGFGALVGLHWHTVPELTGGYKVNDRVQAGQPDVERKWKATPSPFLGINLDAALFVKLLGTVAGQ